MSFKEGQPAFVTKRATGFVVEGAIIATLIGLAIEAGRPADGAVGVRTN